MMYLGRLQLVCRVVEYVVVPWLVLGEDRVRHKFGSIALHVDGGGVVWELEVDRSAGEHDGGEGGLGAVEAVGAADEKSYLVVESFVASVGQAMVESGGDPSRCLRIVRAVVTNSGIRLRCAFEHQRSSKVLTVPVSRSPASTARGDSLS